MGEGASAGASRPDERRGARRAALALGGAGIATFVAGVSFGSRTARLVGLAGAVAGAALYARERLAARSRRIAEAESSIRSTLDDLDPVAKAQVIKDMTQDLLGG
jgi:hypothetical protein